MLISFLTVGVCGGMGGWGVGGEEGTKHQIVLGLWLGLQFFHVILL